MKKPLTKEYHLNLIEFPTAKEAKEMTMINIERECSIELLAVYKAIKARVKNKDDFSLIPSKISEPVMCYLRDKGFSVKSFFAADEFDKQQDCEIRW